MYKLQFFTYIFAALLPNLSRLFCHFVQRMFMKMNTRHQAHKPVKSATTGARFSKRNGQEGQTASACQISWRQVQPSPRYGDFRFFQDGDRPPSWICHVRVLTTHEGHLLDFITVQDLVLIDAVVSIICKF